MPDHPIHAEINAVASGQFLDEAGEVVEATAVCGNPWITEFEHARVHHRSSTGV